MTSHIFFALSLFACAIYGALALRTLSWNPAGRGNRAFALLCGGCALWSLGMAMMLVAADEALALLWYRVAATGWFVAPAATLDCYLRLTYPEWLARRRGLVALIYTPVPFFVIKSWRDLVGPAGVQRSDHGWVEQVQGIDAWYAAYLAYVVLFTTPTLCVAGYRWYHATNPTDRLQSAWLTLGGVVLLPIVGAVGLLRPVFAPGAPESAHLLVLVWVLAAWRAAEIRNSFRLSPSLVVDQLLDALGEALLITDRQGRVQTANPAAARLFACSQQQLVGSSAQLLLPAHREVLEQDGLLNDDLHRVDLSWHPPEVERSQDAEPHWLSITTTPLRNPIDDKIGVLLTLHDVSKVKRAEGELRQRAETDPLTSLANRTLFEERLETALQPKMQSTEEDDAGGSAYIGVVFIDLDGFKQVNDLHGHAVGDQLLAAAAQRLLRCVRQSDIVARIGGDEFVVLTGRLEDPADVRYFTDRILLSLERMFRLGDVSHSISASIGVAVALPGTIQPVELMRLADQAMYRAKRSNRGIAEIKVVEHDASPGEAGGAPGTEAGGAPRSEAPLEN